jgi:hypothetical protein
LKEVNTEIFQERIITKRKVLVLKGKFKTYILPQDKIERWYSNGKYKKGKEKRKKR